MKRILGVLLAVLLLAPVGLAAQEKEKKKAGKKEDRWAGLIQRSNKEASTVTVRRDNIEKTVVYDSSTKWTKGTKMEPADASEFKDGSRVICLGKYDEKGRLMATQITLRAPR